MRGSNARFDVFAAQRGHLFNWSPVFLGLGIGLWFMLRFEPGDGLYALAAGGALTAGLFAWRGPAEWAPLALALALVAAGLLVAGARAHLVAAPVLGFRYYGPVEGRIVKIDRSRSNRVRLTLDQVVLERVAPARTPRRVRLSLHGRQGWIRLQPGVRVVATAHLLAPQGPVEPGGFDFRRQAWFQGLGGVGYTRTPVLAIAPPRRGLAGLWLARLRQRISVAVRAGVPGEAGAFAAAVTTGDRSAISPATVNALRIANLAHLLAISGLHMGLLVGFVFATMRYGLALLAPLALRLDTKKLAAGASLVIAAGYLAISGANVATQRAFVMVTVMLVAVLLDRRALSLRAVALAALIVLVLRPESLYGPGFQMSFAATTALIAAFGALRGQGARWRLPRVLRPVLALAISSLVAGLATAPFAAAHFNRLPHYGLIANLAAVPAMGTLVMPGAVLAALGAPFGLEGGGFALMRAGIVWILAVARWVAGLNDAVSRVVTPGDAVLPLIALGALWLVLWRGRARFAGLAALALAFWLWGGTERPPLLVSESGRLLGAMGPRGRMLSRAKGDGFVARLWLENDGDMVSQATAFARGAKLLRTPGRGMLESDYHGRNIVQLLGRSAASKLAMACAGAQLVIIASAARKPMGCALIDGRTLKARGALALWPKERGWRIVGANDLIGHRLWAQ